MERRIVSDMIKTAQPILGTNSHGKRWRTLIHVMWMFVAALALVIIIGTLPTVIPLAQRGGLVHQRGHVSFDTAIQASPVEFWMTIIVYIVLIAVGLLCWTMAVILFWKKRHNRMVLFVSFYLLWTGVVQTNLVELWEFYIEGMGRFTTDVLMTAFLPVVNIILMAVFPNGRFVPRWMRWVVIFSFTLLPLAIAAYWIDWDLYSSNLTVVGLVYWAIPTFSALYAQVYRYRNVSGPIERQQTKWIIYGFALTIVLYTISGGPYIYIRSLPAEVSPEPWILLLAISTYFPAILVLPLVLTFSVLRYRLWDLDILINRTFVYTTLTGMVVALYILVVGTLSVVFNSSDNLLVSLIATGVVAITFQPMRDQLQRNINRMMYGERQDPYAVLKQLSVKLDIVVNAEQVLPTIVETIAQTLKLPYVAIALLRDEKFKVVASYPEKTDLAGYPETDVLTLAHQSEIVGRLVLAPRNGDNQLSTLDKQLLDTIAKQTSIAAYNVRLVDELQRSREQLVVAREEERRRLRRDLHDGLGPVLATISVGMDSIPYLADKPDKLHKISQDLKAQALSALDDIRRIAYNLRPPALDELGLLAAIQQFINANTHPNGLHILFEAPDQLPELPAAVEVAAYRIVLEAVNNVIRHANAQNCHVRLSYGSYFYAEIMDDGCGMPEKSVSGVGLQSMQERVAELGGFFDIQPQSVQGGTSIFVKLPLPPEEDGVVR